MGDLQGDAERALFFVEAAQQVMFRLGETPPRMARVLLAQARAYLDRGELARAGGASRRALAMLAKLSPAPHGRLTDALYVSAEIHLALGELALALEQFEQGRQATEKRLGFAHPQVGVLLSRVGTTKRLLGQAQQAQVDLLRAAEIMPPRHHLRPSTYVELARALAEEQRSDEARQYYAQALRVWGTLEHHHRARSTRGLAQVVPELQAADVESQLMADLVASTTKDR